MTSIIIALVLSVVAIAVAAYQMKTKQHKPDGTELAIVAEIPETIAFGVVLLLLGLFMLIGKLAGMPIAGSDSTSFVFTAVFGAVLVIAGVQIMLMSLVKRTIAYKDKIVAYNSLGNTHTIAWAKVTSVKVQLLSRSATFKSANDSITVNGRRDEYFKLVQVASQQVPRIVASDDLGRLLRRLARQE